MRLLLDVNLWSYIAVRGEDDAFRAFEQEVGVESVVAPSMLLEALDTVDENRRRLIVSAMANPRRTYLPTEAQTQGTEVVEVVRRLRPDWLRRRPTTSSIPALEAFWTKRIWQLARDDPQVLFDRHGRVSRSDEAKAELVKVQTMNKEAYEDAKAESRNTGESAVQPDAVEDLFVTFNEHAPAAVKLGWEGDRIEAWRHEIALVYWHGLITVPRRARRTGEDTTLSDWTSPWLVTSKVAESRESWNRLWYYEAPIEMVPRNWLPWAVFSAQLTGKSGGKAPGNSVDAQHASYLLDADVFATADRRYARTLKRVLPNCPAPTAKVHLVSGEGSVVDGLRTAIR